jgi:GntR family transcriptional regulator/MocR family aminotransferase
MAAAGGPGDARHASGGDAQPAGAGLVSAAPGHRQLSQYLARLSCTAEQVLITSGYSGSLRLILDTLASRSDKVVFEDPGYFMGQQLLKRIVPRLHTVPVDRCGIDTDYLLRHHRDARFAIVTPSHQSPLAVTLSLPRKQQLLDWASQNEAWIIEDDYDGEFHYTRKVLPSLKSLDQHDRVIFMGTFSKTIMPSLRMGYVVMPASTVGAFTDCADITTSGQPVLTQKILTAFLNEGHFFRHLKKMRALYQTRRDWMIAALQVYGDLFFTEQNDGGMHIVAFLTKGSRDREVARCWQEQQLQVNALSEWYRGSGKRYGLVMGYNNVRSYQEALDLLERPKRQTLALLRTSPGGGLRPTIRRPGKRSATGRIHTSYRDNPTSLSCSSLIWLRMRRVRLMRYQLRSVFAIQTNTINGRFERFS